MDKSKIKKTYYYDKSLIEKINNLALTLTDNNVTKVVNVLLEFSVYCVGLMLQYKLDLENIEKIFEDGLNKNIGNLK